MTATPPSLRLAKLLGSPVATPCREIHAHDSIAARRPLLGRSAKAIESTGDGHGAESAGLERLDKLCFQQSAADSTGPEIDVTQRTVGQHFADDDVGDLHACRLV